MKKIAILAIIVMVLMACGAHPYGDEVESSDLTPRMALTPKADGSGLDLWIMFNTGAPKDSSYVLEIMYPSAAVIATIKDANGITVTLASSIAGKLTVVYDLKAGSRPQNIVISFTSGYSLETHDYSALLYYGGGSNAIAGEYVDTGTSGTIPIGPGPVLPTRATSLRMVTYMRAYLTASPPSSSSFTSGTDYKFINLQKTALGSANPMQLGTDQTFAGRGQPAVAMGALLWPPASYVVQTAGEPWSNKKFSVGGPNTWPEGANQDIMDLYDIDASRLYTSGNQELVSTVGKSWVAAMIQSAVMAELGVSTVTMPYTGMRYYWFKMDADKTITRNASLNTYDVWLIIGFLWE